MKYADNNIFYNSDNRIDRSTDYDIRKQKKIRVVQKKAREEVMLWEH